MTPNHSMYKLSVATMCVLAAALRHPGRLKRCKGVLSLAFVPSASRVRTFRALTFWPASMLKLWTLTFFDKIYVSNGRNPKRELGNPVEIGYSEITCVDDIHADEDICAIRQVALCNTNTGITDVVEQPDIYQIGLYL